jgi:hypothetical protein
MTRRFLLAPSLAVTALVLLTALAYPLVFGWLSAFAERFYGSSDQAGYPFLAARVVGYRTFFWVLSAILALWCAALAVDPRVKAFEASFPSRPWRVAVARVATVAALLAMAVAAALLSDREWQRYGQPCWDNYCLYSTLLADGLRHPSSQTWAALHAFMRSDYHSNSPLVPLLVAATALTTGVEVVTSYRLVCGAATVLTLALLFSFLRSRRGVSSGRAAATILLVGSNIAVIRCSWFPQTDAFVFLWITLAVTQAAIYIEHPTGARALGFLAVLTTGLFVKLSFLPALAILPLWTALEARAVNRVVMRPAALFVLVTLVVFI